MKTRKTKAGFTLVELMVVAIIVAILAAVAIPLMTGNKDRAMATEGQAGCTTIATQIRMYYAEEGNDAPAPALSDLNGIRDGDLDGTYFNDESYSITSASDSGTYTIRAAGKVDGDAEGRTVIMTVTGGEAEWTGNLIIPEA